MIQSNNLFVLVFHFLFMNAKAQPKPNGKDTDESNDVQPNLAVLVGILSMIVLSTFLLLLYAKLSHMWSSDRHNGSGVQDSFLRSRFSGIDKTVVESLPYFRFSALKGSKAGLECAVCLSKFEDIEILRLLPKCKHAFHISCIDQWLDKHSSCPICRQKVTPEDVAILKESTSFRFLWNHTDQTEESHLEIYVEREEEDHNLHGKSSSRFCIGSSFREPQNGHFEEQLPVQQSSKEVGADQKKKVLDKFNHKINISDVVLKNRWSNITSSDLLFLNSEMLSDISSNRFPALEISSLESRMDMKEVIQGLTDSKHGRKNSSNPFQESSCNDLNTSERRSMSEITVHPRFRELNIQNNGNEESSFPENNVREERVRRLWLSIARRTVQWFSNRDRRMPLLSKGTMQSSVDNYF